MILLQAIQMTSPVSPTQDAEQQKSDVKEEQKQSSDSDKSTSDAETANGDHSQPT